MNIGTDCALPATEACLVTSGVTIQRLVTPLEGW
jgi:hypothetical protein